MNSCLQTSAPVVTPTAPTGGPTNAGVPTPIPNAPATDPTPAAPTPRDLPASCTDVPSLVSDVSAYCPSTVDYISSCPSLCYSALSAVRYV